MGDLAHEPKAAQQQAKPVDSVKTGPAPRAQTRDARSILQLQRAAGNQAVLRLLQHANIQPKLKVGDAHDAYEQEADHVADTVTRMAEPQLQRACACGGDAGAGGSCDECAGRERQERGAGEADGLLQRAISERPTIQRRVAGGSSNVGSSNVGGSSAGDVVGGVVGGVGVVAGGGRDVPPQVDSALAAGGSPLDAATRQYFEPRFGRDFSGVRVHVDDAATESVQARAFTVGERIVFASNQYRPTTDAGRRLLAHELTHVVQQSDPASPGASPASARASARETLQRKEPEEGEVRVIAKENGRVAVVLVRGGKIVQGYAEIMPPPGTSAAAAVPLIKTRVTAGVGPLPKVDVILPPGWGRQATNPAAAVKVTDTATVEHEQEQAAQQAKVDELREMYRQYLNDMSFQYEKFGDMAGALTPFGGAEYMSDEKLLALPADNFFFEWMQRQQSKQEWKDFQTQTRANFPDADPETIKEMWKTYRQSKLVARQQVEKQYHDIRFDPEHALQQTYAEPLLIDWMRDDPKPVEVESDGGKAKMYVLALPDGTYTTLDERQYAKLRQVAKDKLETQVNSIQRDKDLYQSHWQERGRLERWMDVFTGSDMEGKNWGAIDAKVKAARDALKRGDLKATADTVDDAQKEGRVARKEWNRYLHHREVAGEVLITGLELVKKGSEIALAVGTAPLGGTGLLIVTGKNVGETVLLAAVKQGAEHVDWGDVGFEVGTHIVTGALMHGFSKVMALGPKNPFMTLIRENYGAQITADALQSVLVDSATYAARRRYEEARGRGEKFTKEDFFNHVKKYLSDPTGLPADVLKAQLMRAAGIALEGYAPKKAAQAGEPSEQPSADGKGTREADQGKSQTVEGPGENLEANASTREQGPGKGPGVTETPTRETPGAGDESTRVAQDSGAGTREPGPNGASDAVAGGSKPLKRPPKAEAEKISELVKDEKNIREVTDPSLVEDYDIEITVEAGGEQHTYRRKRSDETWCRFSARSCGRTFDWQDLEYIEKWEKKQAEKMGAAEEGADYEDQAFVNRQASREKATTTGWNVEDYYKALGTYDMPEQFNFPGIDGWQGGKPGSATVKGTPLSVVDRPDVVIQIKALNSSSAVSVIKQYNKGIKGLNRASWRGKEIAVRNPKARELHMVFEEGVYTELGEGQQKAELNDLMKTMTDIAPNNHYPIKVKWYRMSNGTRVPISGL